MVFETNLVHFAPSIFDVTSTLAACFKSSRTSSSRGVISPFSSPRAIHVRDGGVFLLMRPGSKLSADNSRTQPMTLSMPMILAIS